MSKIHHATVAMLAKFNATIEAAGDGYVVTVDGVLISEGSDAKATAAAARTILEAEDFDLEALRDEQDENDMDDVEQEIEDGDDTGETEGEETGTGSVVKAKYRAKYREIGANDSNGDDIAVALREAITVVGEKARDVHADLARLQDIADQNGLPLPTNGRNPGHTRMIFGNILRGVWKRGTAVHIGNVTIEPTPEAKAKAAQRFADEQAKAERKAAPRKSAEEKKAARNERAKARRAAKRPATQEASPAPAE